MKNKNLVKLFFVSMLFVITCKTYVKEKEEIDSLLSKLQLLITRPILKNLKIIKGI